MSLKLTPGTCIVVTTPTQFKRVLFANAKLHWLSGDPLMKLYTRYVDKLPMQLNLRTERVSIGDGLAIKDGESMTVKPIPTIS